MKTGVSARIESKGWANSRRAQPYIQFLMIWGSQWVLSSCIDFFGQWTDVERLQQSTLWLAAGASLWALWRVFRSNNSNGNEWNHEGGNWLLLILMSAGAIFVFLYGQAAGPLFTALLKSFVLAMGYVQLGFWLGRPFVFLGLWLFALTVVVAFFYLGYAPMVLGGFGGISMLALGLILYKSNKKTEGKSG